MPYQSKLGMKCPVCLKTFQSDKYYLAKHMRIHSGENIYKCNICDLKFRFNADLNIHKRKIHLGEIYKCETCNKTFSRQSNLNLHVRIVHVKDTSKCLQCILCERSFRTGGDLETHIFTHTGERPFNCKTCDKNFSHPFRLKLHEDRVHTKVRPFVCDAAVDCKKSFKSEQERKQHRQRKHPADGSSFECKICSKLFKSPVYLKKHQLGKHGTKQHICDLCNKGFTLREYLEHHMRSHTGERPFKCNHCFKSFGSLAACIIHEKRHSSARNYKCKECPKEFKTPDDLHGHRNRHHSKVRVHFCTFCGENKCYVKPHELFEHIRAAHVREKPHFCKVCGNESFTTGTAKDHIKKIH